jgi:hypothetical protein
LQVNLGMVNTLSIEKITLREHISPVDSLENSEISVNYYIIRQKIRKK